MNPNIEPALATTSNQLGRFNLPSLDLFHSSEAVATRPSKKASSRGYFGRLEEMKEEEQEEELAAATAAKAAPKQDKVSPLNNPEAFPDYQPGMEMEVPKVEKKKREKPKVLQDLLLDLVNPGQIKDEVKPTQNESVSMPIETSSAPVAGSNN